jgi:uncharacterized membrane protein
MADDESRDSADEAAGAHNNGGGSSIGSTLASKELLIPAVLSAAGAVVAAKAPDMIRRLTSATEQKGEDEAERIGEHAVQGAKQGLANGASGGLAGKALSKVTGGGGGSGGSPKKTRRLPIQRWTDVAVPVEKAYSEWTNFDEFPKFMHRVTSVKKQGQNKVEWQEKIWFSKRQWEGEITDRRKNDRIAWKTTSGMSHSGVVSFHPIGDRLTRVMVTLDFEPNGMIEKMASGMRFVKRAVQADLARFKAHVELLDAKGIDYRVAPESKKGDEQDGDGESKDDGERAADRDDRENRRRQRRSTTAA